MTAKLKLDTLCPESNHQPFVLESHTVLCVPFPPQASVSQAGVESGGDTGLRGLTNQEEVLCLKFLNSTRGWTSLDNP